MHRIQSTFQRFATRLKRNAHLGAFTKFAPRNDGDARGDRWSRRAPPRARALGLVSPRVGRAVDAAAGSELRSVLLSRP